MGGRYRINEQGAEAAVNLFEQAKRYFLVKDFAKARECLENMLPSCDEAYRIAVHTNLAVIYHLLGEYERAKDQYDSIESTIFKEINSLAFYHRYFSYSSAVEKDIDEAVPLYALLKHNELNYLLSKSGAEGIDGLDGGRYYRDIYSEQIFNDGKIRRGKRPDVTENEAAKREYTRIIEKNGIVKERMSLGKTKIGIFVTDVQRHKEGAAIFDLLGILSDEMTVYVYFNNIFENKLVKGLEKYCVVRHVVHMNYTQVHNLLVQDGICGVIDLAEYRLRNNNLALTYWDNRTIRLSEILQDAPLILESELYFSAYDSGERSCAAAVIGDLRFVSNDELLYIKRYVEAGHKVIFESQAFDEPLFLRNFERRLRLLEISPERITLSAGIRPFRSYMEFLSTVKFAFVINGASYIELSELLHTGTPIVVLSGDQVIREIARELKLFIPDLQGGEIAGEVSCPGRAAVRSLRRTFQERLFEAIRRLDGNIPVLVETECELMYEEGGRRYCVDCTCNGDVVVFDDVTGDHSEYFVD